MKKVLSVLSLCALVAQFSMAQVVFRDTFESEDSLSSYEINELISAEQGETHFIEIVDLEAEGVGPSPNSEAGESSGLLIFVNINGGFAEVVNFYTADEFSGNIRVSLDVYMRVGIGEPGSTESCGLGIFHEGGIPIGYENLVFGPSTDYPSTHSDGYYYTMTGEGGSSVDYIFTKGYPDGSPGYPHIVDGSTGMICYGEWADGDDLFVTRTVNDVDITYCNAKGLPELNDDPAISEFWSSILPKEADNQGFGVPANQWMTLTMEYIDGTVTTSINGTVIHTYNDTDFSYTNGKVQFWYEDAFGSQGDAHNGYFDNFTVEQLSTPVESWSVF